MKRILFVLTSTATIGPRNRPTGYEFSEVAYPYTEFTHQSYQVDFASLVGGEPPAEGYDPDDQTSRLFFEGAGFRRLNQSQPLASLDSQPYAAIFFPGGLGPMVDMAANVEVKKLIAQVYERGGVVGAVCHGPVALLNVRLTTGQPLLAGKRVTSFTEAEEEGHSRADVPFLLDAALVEAGAQHSHGAPFEAYTVTDGQLVTGQNPASARAVAQAMIRLLTTQ